jgi:uncharacterized membrane protein (DUF4010 family)
MGESLVIESGNFQLTQLEFLVRMLVACGIGFVIGLEREFASHAEAKQEIFAGVRTFMIVALLGFVAALLSFAFTPWLFITALLGVIVFAAVHYLADTSKGQVGGTTEFTVLLAFLLGGATLLGYVEASLALMVIVVSLLSLKVRLHEFIGRITQEELFAFIRFVVVALLVFPFLPNEAYGPYEAINPREIGWIVILVSGLGFGGYLLTKFLGPDKGTLFAGIAGGLVSSTMTTWVFTQKSRESASFSRQCAVAILAAAAVMALRLLVLIWIFNRSLLPGLLLPVGLMLAASLGAAWYFFRRQGKPMDKQVALPLGAPLRLWEAVLFGLFFIGMLLLVNYANDVFGTKGILLSSAIAGLVDVDAIALSIAKARALPTLTAQNAILIAALVNTLFKMAIPLWLGAPPLRRYALMGYGLCFLGGLIGLVWINVMA